MLVCIDEQRSNSNVILAYRIKDTVTGEVRDFEADELKYYIRKNQLNIINLKLTSNGRLIKQRVERIDGNSSSYTIYDGASISIRNRPVYSEKEQKQINKIMQEKRKSSTIKTINNMNKFFDKLFGGEKQRNLGGYINDSAVSDEFNSGYGASDEYNS